MLMAEYDIPWLQPEILPATTENLDESPFQLMAFETDGPNEVPVVPEARDVDVVAPPYRASRAMPETPTPTVQPCLYLRIDNIPTMAVEFNGVTMHFTAPRGGRSIASHPAIGYDANPAFEQEGFTPKGVHPKVTVPDWATGIGPFPPPPAIDFDTADAGMATAFATVTAHNPTNLCVALVDLTGNPPKPRYAGINDQDMLYPGSMLKIVAMYAAFALKKQVQAFLDAAAANHASIAANDILPIIDAAWRPALKSKFASTRPETAFNLPHQDIVMPQLAQIFDVAAGQATFKKDPGITDKQIDYDGEFTVTGRFADWMRSMIRWSSDPATAKVVDALGFFYINAAVADAGFFQPSSDFDGTGLWLSADYEGHDWVATLAEKKRNAAGPKLTDRWAKAQQDDGHDRVRGNITATAFQTAKFMTLMATDKLVDGDVDSNQKMRGLLASAIEHSAVSKQDGIGSYFKDAFDTDGRTFDVLQAKKGYGNDRFSHECGIIQRTTGGTTRKYVAVVLGSAPAQYRADLNAMLLGLDDAIIARNP